MLSSQPLPSGQCQCILLPPCLPPGMQRIWERGALKARSARARLAPMSQFKKLHRRSFHRIWESAACKNASAIRLSSFLLRAPRDCHFWRAQGSVPHSEERDHVHFVWPWGLPRERKREGGSPPQESDQFVSGLRNGL